MVLRLFDTEECLAAIFQKCEQNSGLGLGDELACDGRMPQGYGDENWRKNTKGASVRRSITDAEV